MEENKTLELVVQELQNRIGQIVSTYETQMAVLKAQASQEIQKLQEESNKETKKP